MKIIYSLSIILVLLSCDNTPPPKKDGLITKQFSFIGQNRSNYVHIENNKTNYVLDIKKENKWCVSFEHNIKKGISMVSSINRYNQLEQYYFNANNSLYKYELLIPNINKRNLYDIQEVIYYDNGIPIINKSNFVQVEIINITNEDVHLRINYMSGNQFLDGKIGIYNNENKKYQTYLNFKKNPSIIILKKKDVLINNSYLDFFVKIHTKLKIKNESFKTEDGKEDYTFAFLINKAIKEN